MKVMYTGTFDPWHKGHQNIYNQACNLFGKENVHVVIAKNSKKISNLKFLRSCLNIIIPKSNIHINTGLTSEFCLVHGFDAIIRGIRGVADCNEEFTIADWNKNIQTVFLYCDDPYLRKVSSSAIKELESYHEGSTKKYFPNIYQYYKWKYKNKDNKYIYFGKIASGKSTYLKNKLDVIDLDDKIWKFFSSATKIHLKNSLKEIILSPYTSTTALAYCQQLKQMSEYIDWSTLLTSNHVEASALGSWFKYIPANLITQYSLIKVVCKDEATRKERLKKRGISTTYSNKIDKFYKDPPYYDYTVRV